MTPLAAAARSALVPSSSGRRATDHLHHPVTPEMRAREIATLLQFAARPRKPSHPDPKTDGFNLNPHPHTHPVVVVGDSVRHRLRTTRKNLDHIVRLILALGPIRTSSYPTVARALRRMASRQARAAVLARLVVEMGMEDLPLLHLLGELAEAVRARTSTNEVEDEDADVTVVGYWCYGRCGVPPRALDADPAASSPPLSTSLQTPTGPHLSLTWTCLTAVAATGHLDMLAPRGPLSILLEALVAPHVSPTDVSRAATVALVHLAMALPRTSLPDLDLEQTLDWLGPFRAAPVLDALECCVASPAARVGHTQANDGASAGYWSRHAELADLARSLVERPFTRVCAGSFRLGSRWKDLAVEHDHVEAWLPRPSTTLDHWRSLGFRLWHRVLLSLLGFERGNGHDHDNKRKRDVNHKHWQQAIVTMLKDVDAWTALPRAYDDVLYAWYRDREGTSAKEVMTRSHAMVPEKDTKTAVLRAIEIDVARRVFSMADGIDAKEAEADAEVPDEE